MPYVLKRNMGFVIGDGRKVGAAVLYDDLTVGIRLARSNYDVERVGVRVHTMFDGILYNRLQSERRHQKTKMWRVVVHKEPVFKLVVSRMMV